MMSSFSPRMDGWMDGRFPNKKAHVHHVTVNVLSHRHKQDYYIHHQHHDDVSMCASQPAWHCHGFSSSQLRIRAILPLLSHGTLRTTMPSSWSISSSSTSSSSILLSSTSSSLLMHWHHNCYHDEEPMWPFFFFSGRWGHKDSKVI